MCETSTVKVPFAYTHHLRLSLQASERGGVDDSCTIPLEWRADVISPRRICAKTFFKKAAVVRPGGARSGHGAHPTVESGRMSTTSGTGKDSHRGPKEVFTARRDRRSVP